MTGRLPFGRQGGPLGRPVRPPTSGIDGAKGLVPHALDDNAVRRRAAAIGRTPGPKTLVDQLDAAPGRAVVGLDVGLLPTASRLTARRLGVRTGRVRLLLPTGTRVSPFARDGP